MKLRERKKLDVPLPTEQSQTATASNSPTTKARLKLIHNAEAQRFRLKRLKESPLKYKQFRLSETVRLLQHRMNRTEAQKARDRQTAKLRMRRLRQQRREGGAPPAPASKKTRAGTTEQRAKWREQQRRYRASLSKQKKRRINEQRRQKRHSSNQPSTPVDATPSTGKATHSDMASRKALSRTWRVAPKSPEQFASVITSMIEKSTPRKRAALRAKGISPSSRKRIKFLESTSVKVVLDDIRKSRKNRDIQLRRLLYQSICIKRRLKKTYARSQLGLSWAFLSSPLHLHDINYRKKRRDAISSDAEAKVLNFYERSARQMPMSRSVLGSQPVKVMECTLRVAYSEFQTEFPEVKLSFSKFLSLRPKHVKPVANTKLMQCLCEYCINVDFKIQALYATSNQAGHRVIHHKYQASSLTLCPNEDLFPKKECIDRECNDCGVDKLRGLLQPMLDECGSTEVKWKCWESEAYTKTTKSGIESEAKHFVLKEKVGKISELVNELLDDLEPFSKHLANAKWQGSQFDKLRLNVPADWLLTCMDFAQNYNCHFQDEIQSAHWSYQQATIHPVVAYYQCPECSQPMHESCIFISDDMKHDYHAVQHFAAATNKHLVDRGLSFKQQVQFSDGSPTQYKSKIPFSDASHGYMDFGWRVQKHFFGTRHGKGPCDAEIGVVKKVAHTAVRSRRVVIRNAWELYQFCKESLSEPKTEGHVHMRRSFFFVKAIEVNRDRGARVESLKPVPNTRANHCFIGVEPFLVSTKERSCFCKVCTDEDPSHPCENRAFTGEPRLATLKAGISTSDQSTNQVRAKLQRAKTPSVQVQPAQILEAASLINQASNSSFCDEQQTLSASASSAAPTTADLQEGLDSTSLMSPPTTTSFLSDGEHPPASGDYVAVKFEQPTAKASNTAVVYMAIVLDSSEDGLLKLQFMRQRGNRFTFTEEVFHHPLQDIVARVCAPDLAPRSMNQYVFWEDDLERVRAVFAGKCVIK